MAHDIMNLSMHGNDKVQGFFFATWRAESWSTVQTVHDDFMAQDWP